VNKPF